MPVDFLLFNKSWSEPEYITDESLLQIPNAGERKVCINTLWKAETRVPERNRPKATAFRAGAWASQHDGATALFSLLMAFKTGSCSRTPRVVPPHRRVSVSSSMEAVYTWSNRVYSIDSNSDCELLTSQLWLAFFLRPKAQEPHPDTAVFMQRHPSLTSPHHWLSRHHRMTNSSGTNWSPSCGLGTRMLGRTVP